MQAEDFLEAEDIHFLLATHSRQDLTAHLAHTVFLLHQEAQLRSTFRHQALLSHQRDFQKRR